MAAPSGPIPSGSGDYETPDINTHADEAKKFNQDMYDKNLLTKLTTTENQTDADAVNAFAKGATLIRQQ